jgi:hypothetical protein
MPPRICRIEGSEASQGYGICTEGQLTNETSPRFETFHLPTRRPMLNNCIDTHARGVVVSQDRDGVHADSGIT